MFSIHLFCVSNINLYLGMLRTGASVGGRCADASRQLFNGKTTNLLRHQVCRNSSGRCLPRNFSGPMSSSGSLINQTTSLSKCRGLHTTRPRPLHPAAVLVLRPLARLLVALLGRGVRKWWRRQPQTTREAVWLHVARNVGRYAGGALLLGSGAVTAYWQHLSLCPYTSKWRFMMFQQHQLAELDTMSFQEELTSAEDRLMPVNSPEVQAVIQAGNRLVQASDGLVAKDWQVAVIESPMVNCYCLSSGQVVMFTGMLEMCANEDQLAAVLAHEMAHVVLEHPNIKLSHECLVDLLLLPLVFLSWCLASSDVLSLLTSWAFRKTSTVSMILPYSRELELEADMLGLSLLALACYDVREVSAFWQQLQLVEEQQALLTNTKKDAASEMLSSWLSTHPSHEVRHNLLDYYMEQAVTWRESVKCPKLCPIDPRDLITKMARNLNNDKSSSTANKSDYFGLRKKAQAAFACPACRKKIPDKNNKGNSSVCCCYSTETEYISLSPGVTYEPVDESDTIQTEKTLYKSGTYDRAVPSDAFSDVASKTARQILTNTSTGVKLNLVNQE